MKPLKIAKNTSGITSQIITSGLLTLLACLVIGLFFYRIGNIAPTLSGILVVITWVTLIITWSILSLREYVSATRSTYTLMENSLSVSKVGLFGSSIDHLYRYDSIVSISSSSVAGGSYGMVTLYFDRQPTVTLKYIDKPTEQAAHIKKLVNENRRYTTFI